MKIDRKGVTRIVFIFRNFVIKIPNFIYEHQHFLQGCYGNWSERKYCIMFKKIKDEPLYDMVAPSYFCSWFGLLQIQARVEPLLRDLTEHERGIFRDICGGDIKKENFGWYKGRLVCVDYAI